MPRACTEDQLVEQPAIGLFAEYSAGPNPHPRPFSHWEKGGSQAGLRVHSLVVLVSRLRAALERLNPVLPQEAITAGGLIEWLTADCRKSLISRRFLFE
jgi:type I restriction enzyme, R subunit